MKILGFNIGSRNAGGPSIAPQNSTPAPQPAAPSPSSPAPAPDPAPLAAPQAAITSYVVGSPGQPPAAPETAPPETAAPAGERGPFGKRDLYKEGKIKVRGVAAYSPEDEKFLLEQATKNESTAVVLDAKPKPAAPVSVDPFVRKFRTQLYFQPQRNYGFSGDQINLILIDGGVDLATLAPDLATIQEIQLGKVALNDEIIQANHAAVLRKLSGMLKDVQSDIRKGVEPSPLPDREEFIKSHERLRQDLRNRRAALSSTANPVCIRLCETLMRAAKSAVEKYDRAERDTAKSRSLEFVPSDWLRSVVWLAIEGAMQPVEGIERQGPAGLIQGDRRADILQLMPFFKSIPPVSSPAPQTQTT